MNQQISARLSFLDKNNITNCVKTLNHQVLPLKLDSKQESTLTQVLRCVSCGTVRYYLQHLKILSVSTIITL